MTKTVKNSARYNKSIMVTNRVINYRFSVDSKNEVAYQDLKKVIAAHNVEQREIESVGGEPHFLTVRGRGRGCHTFNGRRYTRSIPDAAATHFDVYVVRDTHAHHRYDARKASATAATASSVVSSTLKALVNKVAGVSA